MFFQLIAQGADEVGAVSVAIAARMVTLWVGAMLGVVSSMSVSGSHGSANEKLV